MTTSKAAEYKEWIAATRKLREAGDVGEFVAWYLDNPSPLGGVFGRSLTRAEIRHRAVVAAGTWFPGTRVEVIHRGEEDPVGVGFTVAGAIVGQGFVTVGGASQEAIMLKTEHGQFIAVPARNVVAIENREG